jgi:phage baseplate assembly protein V
MSGTALSSRIEGLVTGLVIDVYDPDGMGRIQLDLSGQPGRSRTAWAPVASPMAGRDRGIWSMPEVGDEALVGFFNGDTDAPVIVGFLRNGQDTPPSTAPRERMIRSLNGHTIRLIDATPEAGAAGAVVIEDAHGNVITMSNGKVTVKAKALLSLEAPIVTISGTGWSRVVTPNSNPI